MTSFVVFVVCSVRSSTANCSGWTQNLIRKHQGNYFTQDRDSSLFTKEYAKELFEAQGNIVYQDISRKSKAPQDLIYMASVLGKLKTNWCYLRDENHAMDTYAIQWRTAKYLPVRKIFLVLSSTVVLFWRYNFLCGLLFQKPTPNYKDQYLPKKRSRNNKRTSIKKTCLFSGLSKELPLI